MQRVCGRTGKHEVRSILSRALQKRFPILQIWRHKSSKEGFVRSSEDERGHRNHLKKVRGSIKNYPCFYFFICLNKHKSKTKNVTFPHNSHPSRCPSSSDLQACKFHLRRMFLAGHATIFSPLLALFHLKKIDDLPKHL